MDSLHSPERGFSPNTEVEEDETLPAGDLSSCCSNRNPNNISQFHQQTMKVQFIEQMLDIFCHVLHMWVWFAKTQICKLLHRNTELRESNHAQVMKLYV